MKVFGSTSILLTNIVLKALAPLKSHTYMHIFKVDSIQSWIMKQLFGGHHRFGTVTAAKLISAEIHDEGQNFQPDFNEYVHLLRECIDRKIPVEGKQVHGHMIKSGCQSDLFLGNSLINMYCKCDQVSVARQVFDKMPERNVVSWNAMISGYSQNDYCAEAWEIFCQMVCTSMEPDQFTFGSVLKVCAGIGYQEEGKQVHVHIIKTGYQSDVFVGCALVDMYAKCGSIADAKEVFGKIAERNVVSWNAIIAGNAHNGFNKDALKLFCLMQQAGMTPNQSTFASVLSACAGLEVLKQGRAVHVHAIKVGLGLDVIVGSALVDMYAKCQSIEDARNVFDRIPKRNVVSWTSMIAGYAQHEQFDEAFQLFEQMQQAGVNLNQFTYSTVLAACTNPEVVEQGKKIHAKIVKGEFQSDISLSNALINMYAKCGSVEDGRIFFDKMLRRDVFSWTAMITGYAQNMFCEDATEIFCQMQREGMKPESFTFASALSAYAHIADMKRGKTIHAYTIKTGFESDVSVGSALLTMYSKCGSIDDSEKMFHIITERDVVSWTSMIAGYTEHGYGEDALQCFEQMKQTGMNLDKFTSASVVGACSSLDAFEQGKAVHAHILKIGFELDSLVGSALVTMYSRCGNIESAHQVFEIMPEKDLVLWSAMMAGYAQNGHGEEAMKLFNEMQMADVYLDSITFASILAVCGNLADLEQGKQIHANIMKYGVDSNVSVGSALLTMYAKCGTIDIAHKVFDGMHEKDVISWTAMIVGCAQHGRGEKALQLFEQMQQTGMKPDHVSFIGVLSACSHVGLVNEAYHYFNSMNRDYGITPRIEHYACIVDLLGRAGCLDEAESFINDMPFEPGALVWGTLLGACRVHGNMKLGEKVAERLLELEPQIPTAYVLLSNIYAEAGRWDDVEKVRTMMKENCVKKEPGHSWIEITHTRGQSKVGMFN
jgi:pentatricopeptide repeat protein